MSGSRHLAAYHATGTVSAIGLQEELPTDCRQRLRLGAMQHHPISGIINLRKSPCPPLTCTAHAR